MMSTIFVSFLFALLIRCRESGSRSQNEDTVVNGTPGKRSRPEDDVLPPPNKHARLSSSSLAKKWSVTHGM